MHSPFSLAFLTPSANLSGGAWRNSSGFGWFFSFFFFKSYWTNFFLGYYFSFGVSFRETDAPAKLHKHDLFCCHCFSNDFLCPWFRKMSLFRTTQKSKWILRDSCKCSKLNVNLSVTQSRHPASCLGKSEFSKALSKVVGVFLVLIWCNVKMDGL